MWDVLVSAAVVVTFILLRGVIGRPVSRWFSDRERRRGRVEAAVRVVDAGQRKGAGWQHGLVRPGPGHLTFHARGPLRFPSRTHEGVRYPVSGLSPAEPIPADLRSMWVIDPRLHVVRFESHGQVYELAARASDLDFVRARVDSPPL